VEEEVFDKGWLGYEDEALGEISEVEVVDA